MSNITAKEIRNLWTEVNKLRQRTTKLPTRITNAASGGGGGGSSSSMLLEVETYDDLPEPTALLRRKLYRIRSGVYMNGIAHACEVDGGEYEWHLLNYWT